MASPTFSLMNQGTGANQWSDQNFALPAMSDARSSAGAGTGYEVFASPTTRGKLPGPNQPSPTPTGPPNVVPPQNTPINTNLPSGIGQGTTTGSDVFNPNQPIGGAGGVKNVGSGAATVTSMFPQFTAEFYNYLQSQLGKGATPFNLATTAPSSGKATAPGALNAPLTDINKMLESFYQTGTGGPTGTSTLESMAQTGNPTDVGPAWQAMLAAEQKNTDRNAANLREQFAFGGDLKSSPFASSMTDFYNQNTLNQNAQLTQAQQQTQEAAAGRQMTAGQDLTAGATGMGTELQNLDQSAIQNMLAEFIRTNPDYSPLLGALGGAATTFAPTISGSVGVGGMGGAVGSAGTALSGIADLWSTLSHASGPAGASSGPSGPTAG
jgi:hypothetical protein